MVAFSFSLCRSSSPFLFPLSLPFILSLYFSLSPKFINLLPQLSQSLGSQACTAMIHHAGLIYMHLCMDTHIFRVLRMEPKASCLVLCHWVTLQSLPCVLRKDGSQVTYSLSEANKRKTHKTAAAIPMLHKWMFKEVTDLLHCTANVFLLYLRGQRVLKQYKCQEPLYDGTSLTHTISMKGGGGVIRFFFLSWMFLH